MSGVAWLAATGKLGQTAQNWFGRLVLPVPHITGVVAVSAIGYTVFDGILSNFKPFQDTHDEKTGDSKTKYLRHWVAIPAAIALAAAVALQAGWIGTAALPVAAGVAAVAILVHLIVKAIIVPNTAPDTLTTIRE